MNGEPATEALRSLLAEPRAAAILAAFRQAGVEARIVGGAVRDAVMGRPPGDIDIATPMAPPKVAELVRRQGWKAVPTGIEHGTITVVIDGSPYEVTTLRRDVETDGRRAVVAFTDDFRVDALRRDFTLNALSLSDDGVVHDYATGLADARAGVIRFVGEPETRIREDYLRILRFFRFRASHGRGAPDAAALAACAQLGTGMAQLSRERVRQELVKLLTAPEAADAVSGMASIGIWDQILPGFPVDVAAFMRWTELDAALPGGRDAMSALAALAPAAPPKALADCLRLSRAEAALLERVRTHWKLACEAASEPRLLREAVYRIGAEAFPSVLRSAAAIAALPPAAAAAVLDATGPLLAAPPRSPFRSADAAALGIPAGPRMGIVLKSAEAQWIAAGLPADESTTTGILLKAAAASAD